MTTRRTLMFAFAVLLSGAGFASAEDDVDDDHDEARRAVEEGRARPLADILDRIGPRLGGKVIGVELERKQDRHFYEFKVVTPDGRLKEIYVDAMTGEMLRSEED